MKIPPNVIEEEVTFKNNTKHIRLKTPGPEGKVLGYKPQPKTSEEAAQTVFYMGKHKGKTLADVEAIEPSYNDWILSQPDSKSLRKYQRRIKEMRSHSNTESAPKPES